MLAAALPAATSLLKGLGGGLGGGDSGSSSATATGGNISLGAFNGGMNQTTVIVWGAVAIVALVLVIKK